jgi:AcrR family transcriptional regulator
LIHNPKANSHNGSHLTRKAIKTRERIIESSLELFGQKGYQATTLREIASAAGISLGLTYRYFGAKEDLVVALYDRCADDFAEWERSSLRETSLAKRYSAAMRADMKSLMPFRDGFSALFQVGLNPDAKTAVLGESVASVREKVWQTLLRVVEGSKDGPRGAQARELATALYASHLMIVLFWLQDRSDEQKNTDELIQFAEDMLKHLSFVLKLPMTGKILNRFVSIIGPMFGPS